MSNTPTAETTDFAKKENFLGSIFEIENFSKNLSTIFILVFLGLFLLSNSSTIYSQDLSQPYNFSGNPQYNNYMSNSTAFKQEIARLDINVVRQGKGQLPISQVPRLEKNDVLKVRLLDEAVNGIKPDQSNWQWTLLIAYVNPGLNSEIDKSVSEEIQFKKTGWYKEYSFVVPYDNQPIFFLYPKPNYREKILNLINKNKDEIRKIGEKTIEIANAYAKVGAFLNELQFVLNRTAYLNSYNSTTYTSTPVYTSTDPYATYDPNAATYGVTGTTKNSTFNKTQFMEQSIERLARSFNIQMPNCWQSGSYYGGYNNYGSPYNGGGYNSNYNSYGTGYSGTMMGNDLISRTQCLAKSVRLEDLDFSIGKMLQQGGILIAQQLSQQFPQIAHWINIAAVAIDFILKITQKTPLKLVPTVITTSLSQDYANASPSPYANSFAPTVSQTSPPPEQSKISLFAEVSPTNDGFVTAYPIVVHKWQANPDPAVIKLPTPVLTDSCLHTGSNLLASTDVLNDWMSDAFTKDFQLLITSPNGFRKTLALKKNIGFNGWELFLTKEDLDAFPKINMPLSSVVVGKRGFNEVTSSSFVLPSPATGSWEITPKSKSLFASGGRRTITLRNSLNNCRCLQTVVYKPSFGGQFVYDANDKENGLRFSNDDKEVSFDVEATNFQSGDGQLELRQYGGETTTLELKLHPGLPVINEFKVSKGDKSFVINGEGLEQIRALNINGERAVIANKNSSNSPEIEFAFENQNVQILSSKISLDIELQDNRVYQYPVKFDVSIARPVIVSNPTKEVEAVVVTNSQGVYSNPTPEVSKATEAPTQKTKSTQVLKKSPEFPAGSSEITVSVKNALTDYDFKAENINIETRIEDFPNQTFAVELPKANFHVLDWKNIQVSFLITKPFKDVLGEKKLQFRIRDKERGDSDWYTVRNNSNLNAADSLNYLTKQPVTVNKSKTEAPKSTSVQNTPSPAVQSNLMTSNQNNADAVKKSAVETNLSVPVKSPEEKLLPATVLVEQKLALSPNQTVAQSYTATGLEYFVKKDYKAAYEWFYKATIADPQNALYHYNLGSILTALMDFPAAEKEMFEATKLDPENQTYKIGLDAARQNVKNFPEQN